MRDDNRLVNLREANSQQNGRNSSLRNTNKSGVCGVWFCKERNKWEAYIWINYKKINLGRHLDKDDAVRIATQARIENFGEFVGG